MQLKRLGLGIRFDFLSAAPEGEHARQAFEEIFSVLTLTDLEGLSIYGGPDPLTDAAENVFLAVIMGGKLKQMRRIYEKIRADAAIDMYLAHTHPFIENNRLAHLPELAYYGEVQKHGVLRGGDGTLDGLTVPKQRGRRRPVGKGIKVLFAPDGYGGDLSSTDAIKRLTLAARRHFLGVKIVPVPVSYGGRGMVRALVTAAEGAYRQAKITPAQPGDPTSATYGVLYGKTAVIELAETLGGEGGASSSFNAGELIRRALDEGLREIVIGADDCALYDCGMGCMRALGVKFYDAAGEEIKGGAEELLRVASIDAEYLHPRIREAKLTIVCSAPWENARARAAEMAEKAGFAEGARHFLALVASAVKEDLPAGGGMADVLSAFAGARRVSGVDTLFDAVDFNKLLKGVALAVTGTAMLDAAAMREGRAVPCVIARCVRRKVPVAVLAGGIGADLDEASLESAGVATFINAPMTAEEAAQNAEALFDDAADRMFRLIRIGRDVEKIGAPKPPRQRPLSVLHRESLTGAHDKAK